MEELEFPDALASRVRRALSNAQRTVAEAEAVICASRLAQERDSMVMRCAWCGRIALGAGSEVPAFIATRLDERTTHGICPDCVRRLERTGRTRPLE
jgi:hypothetical protein